MTKTEHRGPRRPGVLRQVADFALLRRPEQMPDSALEMAAHLALDTLGVAIAAAEMTPAQIARDTATRLYGTTDPAVSARMLFDGRRVSLPGAVYAAATQIDNLDAHDGHNLAKGHIGVSAVPALAALAETDPDLDGREALATLVVGYEIGVRAAIALHATVSDYHTSGAWNALGLAAMAARRRGLDAERLREALGIAEFHGPRSQMMREIDHPTMLHDGSGWGALAGLSAVILAESGFTGAPAITIEAPEAESFWADLGDVWEVERQYVKPYPICRWAHAAMDAAQAICAAEDAPLDRIASIRIGTFGEAARLFAGAPTTTSQAQYSLPFAVAAMIAHGQVGVDQITGAGLSDPRVTGLLPLIEVVEDPRHSARFPNARWSDLTIAMTDGRVLRSGDVEARGGPERPLSRDTLLAKFFAYATPVLGPARAEQIVERVLSLTSSGARFDDLGALLYAPPSR